MSDPKVSAFNGTNFVEWRRSMELLLKDRDLWTVVNEGKAAQAEELKIEHKDESADLIKIRVKKLDERALAKIGLHLSGQYKSYIQKESSAQAAWKALIKQFEATSDIALGRCAKALANIKMKPGQDMDSYLSEARSLRAMFGDVDFEVPERTFCVLVINGLSEDYGSTLRSSLFMNIKTMTFLSLCEQLQNAAINEPSQRSDSVFYAQPRKNFAARSKGTMLCYCCGSPSHKAVRCPKRHAHSKEDDEDQVTMFVSAPEGVKGYSYVKTKNGLSVTQYDDVL